jgi:hypothetical protein
MKTLESGHKYRPGSINSLANWYIFLNIVNMFIFPAILFLLFFLLMSACNDVHADQSSFYIGFLKTSIPLFVSVFTIISLVSITIVLVLLYKCWNLIQFQKSRTTPVKAVVFCFIPFFNIYWLYVVTVGLAKDMNMFCRENKINVPAMSIIFTTFCCIFTWISLIPYVYALTGIMISILYMIIVKKFAKRAELINSLIKEA